MTDAPSAQPQKGKPDTPPGQAKKEPEEAAASEDSETVTEEPVDPSEPTPAQAVINDLKILVGDVQQAFDALRVTVQTKIEEMLAKLGQGSDATEPPA